MKPTFIALLAISLCVVGCGGSKEKDVSETEAKANSTPAAGNKEAVPLWETPTSLSLFMTREHADGGEALVHVAIAIAEAGDFEQGIEVVRTIKDERASALIALVLSERGDLKQALEVVQTIKDASLKADALRSIVHFSTKEGDFTQALEVARMIKDEKSRADHMRSIVSALIEAREVKQALEVARAIKNVRFKANALREIALSQIKT